MSYINEEIIRKTLKYENDRKKVNVQGSLEMKIFEIIGSNDLNRLENWIRLNRMNFIESRKSM